jgi:hypothetical protein
MPIVEAGPAIRQKASFETTVSPFDPDRPCMRRSPPERPLTTPVPPRPRDPRLDFFRGLGMFIIFIAHVPDNTWTLWIPARFGFSDATEIFVFCSGMASAIAFGGTFLRHGWWMGTARTLHRVWQVYWAHIGLFFVTVALLLVFNRLDTGVVYTERLYVLPLFEDTASALFGLMTLTYVPNYFDILPMYLVILLMMPIVVGLARISPLVAMAAVLALWLVATTGNAELPAEPWSDRVWFFNPFAWQLVFFTGFAFMAGWLKPPPVDRRLVALSLAIIVLTVPFAHFKGWQNSQWIFDVRDAVWPALDKTHFGVLRYVHFLSIAYVAWVAAGEGGRRLKGAGAWGRFVTVTRKVGQQSLAVFLASMALAQTAGMVLDVTGRTMLTTALVNVSGFVLLVAVAYSVAWFKSQPWRKPASHAAAEPKPAAGSTRVTEAPGGPGARLVAGE